MPYEIRHNGNEWCVYNRDTGDSKGCSPTKQEAQAHMDAMYAAENKSATDKMMAILDQKEVNYTPVSTVKGKACSSCMWWRGDSCNIVESYPEMIVSNGYCDRHEIPKIAVEPMPVTIVEPEYAEMSTDEQGLFDRIWGRIQKALNPPVTESAFSVQKDLNGQWRWIATYTNNFKDRTEEIISEAALDGNLMRWEMKLLPMPDLRVGHIPETVHGLADFVFGAGNMVTAVGHFDDTPEAKQAIKYYERNASKCTVSHGFTFPKWGFKDGIYEVINTFEISVLPPPLVAANPFTEFEVQNMKQITPDQKAALALVFGQEKAETIVKTRETQSEEIKAAGVAFKDFAEVTEAAPTTPAPDAQAAIGDLLSQILEGQGELLTLLNAQGKALIAHKAQADADKTAAATQIKALESTVEKLTAQLSMTPRRASESAATAIDETLAKELIGQPTPDKDSFWG